MLLAGFEHRPGVHCGSTALTAALRVRGVELSEPMAFGLGAGLGFYCLSSPALSPTRLFHGRSVALERTACEILGAPAFAREESDPGRAWAGVRSALERGLAPILSTDVAELPYFATRTPFGGHRVVLAGYDGARGTALVADGERPRVEEVSLEALDRARASVSPPFGAPGRPWLEVDAPAVRRPLEEALRDALRRQARDMLLDVDGTAGISALERFADELPAWATDARDERDRAWRFRYAHQAIELRGTGGGLFRPLYARFLAEAEAGLPALARLGLSARMRELGSRWSALATGLRSLSSATGAPVPAAAVALARTLAREERRYHEDVAALVR